MMKPLHRFRRLTGTERRVALEAATTLSVAWIAIRVAGFRICNALRDRSVSTRNMETHSIATLESAQRIAHLTAVTARNLFVRTTCLEKSLALCWMLRRRGMNPELRIGARKEETLFEAHAWVELNGIPLCDDGDQHSHFAPFKTPAVSMEAQPH